MPPYVSANPLAHPVILLRRTLQPLPVAPSPAAVVSAVGADAAAFSVQWAASEDDVREVQRLRYTVFADEMGAHLSPPAGTPAGIDADRFDRFCDHLLVRDNSGPKGVPGAVIGTYRLLAPDAARRAGGFYTDTEFDLAPLHGLRARAVELGRSCVHPAWRSGGVIMALWSALAQYMHRHQLDTMIGCASISVADGGATARQLWLQLQPAYLASECWRVQPHVALRLDSAGVLPEPGATLVLSPPLPVAPVRTPPLIKGYLRCGARLLGPPALDAAFNTADLPMMMRIDDLTPRYRKHFMGD